MKKIWVVLIIVLSLVVFVSGGYLGYYYFYDGSDSSQSQTVQRRAIENPASGLTDEEAEDVFDEEFVSYLLYSIDADELHRPPLSDDRPKIEIYASDSVYSAEVYKGDITVEEGTILNEDITIRTTRLEAIKMIRDPSYVVQSFRDGKSTIELHKGNIRLASKGYIKLYESVTGEKVV